MSKWIENSGLVMNLNDSPATSRVVEMDHDETCIIDLNLNRTGMYFTL